MHIERAASIFDYYFYKKIKRKRKKNKEKYDGSPIWELRKDILNYYNTQKVDDKDLRKVIKYIKEEGTAIFPSPFRQNYDYRDVTVYTDTSGLKYVKYNDHNLYFPFEKSDLDIQREYNGLLAEQDPLSPHCYLSKEFTVEPDDIVLDIGAAEGILSLSVVEKAHKIILFEVDEKWIAALKKTFEPWKEKVEIINKYVSDINSDTTITIDSLINTLDKKSIFFKLDVEGAEEKVLQGSKKLLTSDDYKCKTAICTYHKQDDYERLSALMENLNFKVEVSDGYMLFYHDPNLSAPYFRKALIRCQK